VDEKLVGIIAVIAIVGIVSILLVPQTIHPLPVTTNMHVPKPTPMQTPKPIQTLPKVIPSTTLTDQEFEDKLTQIQLDLKNGTQNLDMYLVQYKNGQISKDQMLNMTDNRISVIQNILPQYDKLNPPENFKQSLHLFRLSTLMEIESDKALREWVVTGDNATFTKSDQLLQQSFQYETNALQSYNDAINDGKMVDSLPIV
jgi:hypothetical protein